MTFFNIKLVDGSAIATLKFQARDIYLIGYQTKSGQWSEK